MGFNKSRLHAMKKKKNTILPSSGTHMAVSFWFLSVLHRARLQRGHVLCDHCCQSHGEQMHCHGWGRWVRWCVFFWFFFWFFFFILCFDFHRKVRPKIYMIWCRFSAADIPVESCRIVARKFLQQFRNMCTNLKGSRPFIELKEACIIILNGSLNVAFAVLKACCQKDSRKDVSLNNPGEKRRRCL